MTRVAPARQVSMQLPAHWEVHDLKEWAAAKPPAGSPVLNEVAALTADPVESPDLLATLFAPYPDADGDLAGVLMASVVVYGVSGGAESVAFPPRVRRGVTVADAARADFWEQSYLVHDAAAGMSALVTFTTPNLPLASDLEPGFRAMAESVRFEVVPAASIADSEVAE